MGSGWCGVCRGDHDPSPPTEVNFTQTTQYVFNKERILPPPPPGALAALLLFVRRAASLPYFFLVSVLTCDLLMLERWVGGGVGGGEVGGVSLTGCSHSAGSRCCLPSPPTLHRRRRCVDH